MALLMVQEGVQPAGQYDGYPGVTWVGGELAALCSLTGDDTFQHVFAVPVGHAQDPGTGPYYLADDGNYGYGVYFGNTVVRAETGFTDGSDSGTRLGPTTYAASSKVTLWDKQGLYAVTLDALDGVEGDFKSLPPGEPLTAGTDGKLVPVGAPLASAVATVVCYKVNESLVTTGGSVVANRKLVINFFPHGVLS